MANATMNVRMDRELKSRVDETASSIGITAAAAFNIFARQFVAHGGFPFEVVAPVPSERVFTAEMDKRFAEAVNSGTVHDLIEE